MSRVRRLSIRGIRNFGDDNDEPSIRFSRPLTLILGPNGTGKTTIIEALKFATTGEFPPGSDRGKSFIHDPVLSATSTVRGVVKAEIIDNIGNTYTISRAIEAVKGNGIMRFKTLNNALSRTPKGSKKAISITNRCADVDAELATAMGVSKPILNYVIFCHQEDLSWPFQDGKKLKEKFDEIFDSARFNKALETIVKQTKEMTTDSKVLKAERDALQVAVNEVEDKEKSLQEQKRRLEDSKAKIAEIDVELIPIKERIEKIEETKSTYKEILVEEEKKRIEFDICNEQYASLKQQIKEIFEGPLEELNAKVESYDECVLKKSVEIIELEDNLKDVVREKNSAANMLADERVTIATLKQQLNDQERKLDARNKLLNEALSTWNMDNVDSNVDELEAMLVIKKLGEMMQEFEQKMDEKRIKRVQEERELQNEVDALRTTYTKIESEKNLKDKEIVEIRQEIKKIRTQIMELDAAARKLNSLESRIEQAKAKVDEVSGAMDVDSVKEDIQDKIKLRNETESKLNTIDQEISALHKQTSLQAELELHKSMLCTKEKEMEKLRSKQGDDIKMLLSIKELTQIRLKDKLDVVYKELVNESNSIRQEIQTEERRLTTLDTTVSHNERELRKKEKEIELDKEKIAAICCYKNFDEVLLLQSKKVKDLQDKRGMYAHQGAAYKEYMKQLKETDPCCPLCHRGFTERESIQKLLREMEGEMDQHPNRLKQCETELKIEREKYDKMLQLKPVVEKIIQSEENDLDNLRCNLEKNRLKLEESKRLLTELEVKKKCPENKLTKCKEITGDIMLWDRCIDEISKVTKMIDNLEQRMAAAGIYNARGVEEAQAERDDLREKLKNRRAKIEQLQGTLNTHNEKVQDARSAYNALHEEYLKIRTDVQKLKQLKDKQTELCERDDSFEKSISALKEKLTRAKCALNLGIQRLDKLKKTNSDQQEMDRKLTINRSRHLSDLNKAQDELDMLICRNIPAALQESEEKAEKYDKTIKEYQGTEADIEKCIKNLKDDLARQEVKKRELLDNVNLRKTEKIFNRLNEESAALRKKLGSINFDQLTDEWKSLQVREDTFLRQKNVAMGNQEELKRSIEKYQQELRKDQYSQARKKYKTKCIELTVQEEAILNLRAYGKVLDTAMIEYHEERMATVNKFMQKMWKLVYTGSDTTSIQIRTEATQGVGNTRRTYNYKLVQTKHGHEMDMRGRCSAGQRVLASIIIRLALAETFCKDCGILALDEPTTNLDEENANSLAVALANVVQIRSQHQKNFQLIVISHDEKFLFKLAGLNNNKGFYVLYRKPNGLTSIKLCQVENYGQHSIDSVKEVSSQDEAEEQSEKSHDKQGTPSGSRDSARSDDPRRKKRFTYDSEDESSTSERPKKRRYVLDV